MNAHVCFLFDIDLVFVNVSVRRGSFPLSLPPSNGTFASIDCSFRIFSCFFVFTAQSFPLEPRHNHRNNNTWYIYIIYTTPT